VDPHLGDKDAEGCRTGGDSNCRSSKSVRWSAGDSERELMQTQNHADGRLETFAYASVAF
jgi:hypothetical protein